VGRFTESIAGVIEGAIPATIALTCDLKSCIPDTNEILDLPSSFKIWHTTQRLYSGFKHRSEACYAAVRNIPLAQAGFKDRGSAL
jgi:hypothetical protein